MRIGLLKSFFTSLSCIWLLNGNAQDIDTLIAVGSYKLHFSITRGKGVPIIFESGAGNNGDIWDTIIPPLHRLLGATLIRYDRQGFGKSEIDTANLNIDNEVRELEIGLVKLGFHNKYFLVAHSLGGNYAMAFMKRNSSKVTGGVFVDVLSPLFMTDQKALEVQEFFQDSLESIKKQSPGFYYLVKNYRYTSQVMRQSAKTLKMPLTIICADTPPFGGIDSINWKKNMRLFAEAVGNRSFLLARNCGHYVFKENPKLVIDAIVKRYKQYPFDQRSQKITE